MKAIEESSETRQKTTRSPRLPIYAFFAGSAISYAGDMLTALAIPWFVLLTTGSVTQTGITAFFSTLPAVFSAFFGSAIIDRLGYKRTSVIGDIASAVTVMLIPLLYHTVGLAFWQLLALVFVGGLLKSPGVTARSSLVPDLAEMASMRLERANALWDGVNRVSGLIGAPLAGFLIAIIGTSDLLWLDAISFAISAVLIGLAVPSTPPVISKEEDSARHYLSRLLDGMRFIRQDSLILTIVVTAMITNLLDGAFFSVLEPAYIKQAFHSAVPLGLIVAALGGAAFVGTIIFGIVGHRLPRRWTFGIGYTIGGSFRFWILLLPALPVIIAWNVIAGLCIAPINPIADTVMQERIPAAMRARVFGSMSAGVLAGIPLGTFAGGFVATWLGLRATLLFMGAVYLLTTLSLLINPALKKMDKR
ncbi:MAG TPA: MFS transporter [Ktedonobacteraceae bacterium]|nr:MFS transporter [Ktedonobacteraceae bacterium]